MTPLPTKLRSRRLDAFRSAGNAFRRSALLLIVALAWTMAGSAEAATLVVTKTTDTNDGVCDSDCSLREAIDAAEPGDTIDIPAGTYTLNPIDKSLVVDKDLKLVGAGAGSTVIQAAKKLLDVPFRVIEVASGAVEISGVTVRHGQTNFKGGGIYIEQDASLSLSESVITKNNDSGVYNSGTLIVENSTIVENNSQTGGGIGNVGDLTVTNSTISGNLATRLGGGVHGASIAKTTITNSTVAANKAGLESIGAGGGIAQDQGGSMSVSGTIISNNTAAEAGTHNCTGPISSAGNNLAGDTSCNLTEDDDLSGSEPLLGPLSDNGGPTPTHALMSDSPAIDTGGGASTADQRGTARPTGDGIDVGAYEFDPTNPPTGQTAAFVTRAALTPTPTPEPEAAGGFCSATGHSSAASGAASFLVLFVPPGLMVGLGRFRRRTDERPR